MKNIFKSLVIDIVVILASGVLLTLLMCAIGSYLVVHELTSSGIIVGFWIGGAYTILMDWFIKRNIDK